MNIAQTVSMALKSIARNKVRSILTMLGIIIGVAAVITLVSVVQGTTTMYRLISEAQGSNRIDINYYGGKSKVRADMENYINTELSYLIKGFSPSAQTYTTISYRIKDMKDTRVFFGNEEYADCASLTLSAGRNLTELDIERRNQVCVIGEAVRKNFFGAMSPIGQYIRINGQSYKVVGVFKGRYGGKLNTEDQMILLPFSLQRRVVGWEDIGTFIARGVDGPSSLTFCDELTKYMEPKAKNSYGYSDFYCWSNEQSMQANQEYTNMLSLVAAGVAGISLLVGGIGIMNIMLVSVTERTREIGIRMAIGARRRDIINQFLIEAAAVSCCGGILGILIGVFGSVVLGNVMFKNQLNSPWMPEIKGFIVLPSPGLVIGAFLFSALLGIIFGLYPANKASKLQPVEALRTQ